MSERPWFETFFDDKYVRLFGPIVAEERTRQEADFIASTLGLPTGSQVLDLACGYGRLLFPLTERGYRMIGVDLSPTLLARARTEAMARSLPVRLVRADMRRIPLRVVADGAYCWFSAIGYFDTDAEDEMAFAGVAAALRPEAPFLLDVSNPLAVFRRYAPKDWMETSDGLRVLVSREYEPLSGRNREDWRIIRPDGTEEHRWFRVRLYTLPELASMLARAGFTVERAFGSALGEPYGLDSRRLIVLCRKPQSPVI